MKINDKLYKLRKKAGLSQEELADKLNVSRQTISKWETGESNPDFDKIAPLCDLFEVSADELIFDKKKEKKVEEIEIDVENKIDDSDYKNWKSREGLVLAICIFLYFLSVVWIIFAEEAFKEPLVSDGVLVCIFLIICGVATSIIVYYYVSLTNKKKEIGLGEEPKSKSKYATIDGIVAMCFLVIYLFVSFLTMGWYITWILWIIYAIVIEIVHTVLDGRNGNGEE